MTPTMNAASRDSCVRANLPKCEVCTELLTSGLQCWFEYFIDDIRYETISSLKERCVLRAQNQSYAYLYTYFIAAIKTKRPELSPFIDKVLLLR